MIFEAELLARDTIKINVLKELMAGTVTLAVQLNDGPIENYATQIHNDMGRVRVYGNFNMSESVDGEILTIRPISVDRVLRAVSAMSDGIAGKEISLVRSATKKVENTYPFDAAFMGMELVPSENKYILRLEYADSASQEEVPAIQEEIPAVQEETHVIQEEIPAVQEEVPAIQEEIPVVREEVSVIQEETPAVQEEMPVSSEEDKLQKIEEELQKDYAPAETQLEECKKRLEIDSRILEYYKDKDFKPVEEVLKEITAKLDEAEKQIALFIQAKQQKTMEIEGS